MKELSCFLTYISPAISLTNFLSKGHMEGLGALHNLVGDKNTKKNYFCPNPCFFSTKTTYTRSLPRVTHAASPARAPVAPPPLPRSPDAATTPPATTPCEGRHRPRRRRRRRAPRTLPRRRPPSRTLTRCRSRRCAPDVAPTTSCSVYVSAYK